MDNVTVIEGCPGGGKTTRLLNLLSEYLDKGVRPNRIGFLSFTKQATEEAKGRAIARFGFTQDDLPYFRTMHSLAFRQLGMSPKQIMGREHYRELGKSLGIEIAGSANLEEDDTNGLPTGDRLLFISGLARVRCEPLRKTWEEVGEDLDFREVEQFSGALAAYKDCHSLSDFTDLLSAYEERGPYPDLDVLFIDEAQDLSQLQWRIVRKLSEHAAEIYLAGDGDQAVFRWAGADVGTFINYPGKVETISKSYRLPKAVQDFAGNIISGVVSRRPKVFTPAPHPGSVTHISAFEEADLSTGEWLILVRNGYQGKPIAEACQDAGYHYSWKGNTPGHGEAVQAARLWERKRTAGGPLTEEEQGLLKRYAGARVPNGPEADFWHAALTRMRPADMSFIRAASRRGEKLSGPARIRISTIHGAKGGESQNVLLFLDMSGRTFEGYQRDPDDEKRVFYVGATRAKENLVIVLPQTGRFFEC